jgi:hypothetical protein
VPFTVLHVRCGQLLVPVVHWNPLHILLYEDPS